MIRPLRTRHRVMTITLAVVLPLLVVAGLAARRAVPRSEDAPAVERAAGQRGLEVVGRDDRAWGELPIRTTWLRGPGEDGPRAVSLELVGPLQRPDLLVYWTEGPLRERDLSDEALLVGRLGAQRRVTLDVPHGIGAGRLLLYSTAWSKVVASTVPPPAWEATP